MRRLLFALMFLGLSAVVQAQNTVIPGTSHLAWDQVGQTAAVANGFTYNVYVDAAPKVALANVTCVTGTPTTNATCTGDWPTMTSGAHTITITQASGAAESAKSTALSITVIVLVVPSNPRQVP